MEVTSFNNIVDLVYNMPLEYKEELKNLLEHNIVDSRRDEILASYHQAQIEEKEGKLKFSSDIDELMKMLK